MFNVIFENLELKYIILEYSIKTQQSLLMELRLHGVVDYPLYFTSLVFNILQTTQMNK